MFKVGDKVKLNGFYSAVNLPKGEIGTVSIVSSKIGCETGRYKNKIVKIKQVVYVYFSIKKRDVGCFDYRLDLLNQQLQFAFMNE
jgi:hypothetical protein